MSAPLSTTPPAIEGIKHLRYELARIEAELRFGGRPYPVGIEPFPRALTGQGFFPGGDGLWRSGAAASLRRPSPCLFPKGGIMFLGNDFGSGKGFDRLKLHENPPTWRLLRERLRRAGVPGEFAFFTNAYLGLRSDRTALDRPAEDSGFARLCAEFLAIQLDAQKPRLVVTLGARPAELLRKVVLVDVPDQDGVSRATYRGRPITIQVASHPYSDIRSELKRVEEGDRLGRAWSRAPCV